MTSHKSVVCLLLMFSVLSASFDPADYLFPSEKNQTVSYVHFTDGGHSYSIVKLNNVDTFLLKGGELATSPSDIGSALHRYYLKEHYPSDEELSQLRALIERFNASRNDGYDFKNKEEYACRDDVLMSNGKITISGEPVVCRDEESCTRNAMLLFSVYGQGLGIGSLEAISDPLLDFTPASLRMDELIENYAMKLDRLDEETLVDTLDYIHDTSAELVPLSERIEGTIFRTPRLNDTEDRDACYLRCWAICPSLDLDQDAAVELRQLAGELAGKTGPISDYESAASSIHLRTQQRLDYVRIEDQATYYTTMFGPLNTTGADAIADGEEAVRRIRNSSLATKLDRLKSLHVTIPEDMASRNFTTTEADMSDYARLAEEVQEGADALLSVYDSALEQRNRASGMMMVLQSKDLDPISAKSLGTLEGKAADLDVRFHDGLSLSELEELAERYHGLAYEAETLLLSEGEAPATRVLLLFRGFANRINTGIAGVADQTDAVSRSEIPQNPLHLGAFSFVVFLSLSSVALLAFLYVLGTGNFQVPKTTHLLGAAFAVVISAIFLLSLLMFVFLGKTSNDASLPEFIQDFSSKGSASIMLDMRGASLSDADAMRSCASHLTSSLTEMDKSWTVYAITSQTCTQTWSDGRQSTMSADACIEEVENSESSIILGYSETNEVPHFSAIYTNRAEIRANMDYYKSCPVVALFS